MKTIIIGAGNDLGCHIDGAQLGPVQLMNDIKGFYKGENLVLVRDENILKSRNLSDRLKNKFELDNYNTFLYKKILEKTQEDYFPILIGGDESTLIASGLASCKKYDNIGLICFDSRANYHTLKTTTSGNINELAVATVTGYENEILRYFHDGEIIQPSKTVIIGVRNIDKSEKDNLKYSGVTVFDDKDIKEQGIEKVIKDAFEIATYKTKGVHVAFDLSLIDPDISPAVSIPDYDGISSDDAIKINEEVIKYMKNIIAYDLYEFNPLRDVERATEQIALNLVAQIIKAAENKLNIETFSFK